MRNRKNLYLHFLTENPVDLMEKFQFDTEDPEQKEDIDWLISKWTNLTLQVL